MKEKKLERLIDVAIDSEVEAYDFYRSLSADSGRLTEKREHQSAGALGFHVHLPHRGESGGYAEGQGQM